MLSASRFLLLASTHKECSMAVTNHERIGKALELLRAGLGAFIEREFTSAYRDQAHAAALHIVGEDRQLLGKPIAAWDAAALLRLMWDAWNDIFRKTLGHAERSLVSELREVRNAWAHQGTFSSDDAYRAMDSAARLLSAVSSPQAEDIETMKMELLRVRFDEQVRGEKRKKSLGKVIESAAAESLKPWREVVTPHPDVASGRYQQAEFAADLWQVHLGQGTDEYRDPVEFFRRTYLTESLKQLLVDAVQRLSGSGGDPVVQLQTNFGGGKTHSMLALYHLFSGVAPSELAGMDAVMQEAGAKKLPKAQRVVPVARSSSAAIRAKAFLPPSCQASSPHSVRTTVPSGLVTGLPGEIRFPTSTTRRTFGSALTPTSCITASMPASSLGAVPENRW